MDYALNVASLYTGSGSETFTDYAVGAHLATDLLMVMSPLKEAIPGKGGEFKTLYRGVNESHAAFTDATKGKVAP